MYSLEAPNPPVAKITAFAWMVLIRPSALASTPITLPSSSCKSLLTLTLLNTGMFSF